VFFTETFIQVNGWTDFFIPMKGTIDAAIPDAEGKILSDQKKLLTL
jgi:hypothetical protein